MSFIVVFLKGITKIKEKAGILLINKRKDMPWIVFLNCWI